MIFSVLPRTQLLSRLIRRSSRTLPSCDYTIRDEFLNGGFGGGLEASVLASRLFATSSKKDESQVNIGVRCSCCFVLNVV